MVVNTLRGTCHSDLGGQLFKTNIHPVRALSVHTDFLTMKRIKRKGGLLDLDLDEENRKEPADGDSGQVRLSPKRGCRAGPCELTSGQPAEGKGGATGLGVLLQGRPACWALLCGHHCWDDEESTAGAPTSPETPVLAPAQEWAVHLLTAASLTPVQGLGPERKAGSGFISVAHSGPCELTTAARTPSAPTTGAGLCQPTLV